MAKWPEANGFRDPGRVVVKVGTSTITEPSGELALPRVRRIAQELSVLADRGKEVVLVTSGAIAAGMGRLGMSPRRRTLAEKQAAAAVGQGILMGIYEKVFGERGKIVAQILLTAEDLSDRKRYLNSHRTLLTLLHYGVIPIINENDTVAVDEIRFGENDMLSALVASSLPADLLIVLSDVDGVYPTDPKENQSSEPLGIISEITPLLLAEAGGPAGVAGTGGMATKLKAAKIALKSGIPMVVANGARENVISDVVAGSPIGTLFLPCPERLGGRKRWIAFHHRPCGSIRVDDGARFAILCRGKSLLPSGVVDVSGVFSEGATVNLLDTRGEEFARGLVNYSSDALGRIMGLHSGDIETVLGYRHSDEVVHRDNMAVLQEA